jgi:hypothetical protein
MIPSPGVSPPHTPAASPCDPTRTWEPSRALGRGEPSYGDEVSVPRSGVLSPVSRRRAGTAAVVALAAAVLAGCGGGDTAAPTVPAPVTAPTTSAAPTTDATPTATPQASPPQHPPAPPKAAPGPSTPGKSFDALLPWPTGDPARLQASVDSGAQPWLLDPTEVALSYADATYGWTDAQAGTVPPGSPTTTTVRATDGTQRTLTLAQPGRTGHGGIWLVTADKPA